MKSKGSKSNSFVQFFIKYRTVLILIALVVAFTAMNPVFVNGKNILNMLKRMLHL